MSTIRKIGQAFIGLILAAFCALMFGTVVVRRSNDVLWAFGSFRLTVMGAGVGLSVLTMLAFANAWIGVRNRQDPNGMCPGRFWNGIGFGFLPAAAVWKTFEMSSPMSQGFPAPTGFWGIPYVIKDCEWMPTRIELAAALILFTILVIWLMLRKRDVPENGDLAGLSLTLYSAVRLLSGDLRVRHIDVLGGTTSTGLIALGVMACVMIWWIVRFIRKGVSPSYALACVPIFVISAGCILMIQDQRLLNGNPKAMAIVEITFALLLIKSVVCAGRVGRS